jgi:hypothetical protein
MADLFQPQTETGCSDGRYIERDWQNCFQLLIRISHLRQPYKGSEVAEPVSATVGTILAGIAAVAGSAWAAFERFKRVRAETGANVAASDASKAIAESQGAVFELMKNRLDALDKEMQQLRSELQAERQHSRRLELHIYKLEGILTKAGLEPPKLDDTP